jgi:hypothetical protein
MLAGLILFVFSARWPFNNPITKPVSPQPTPLASKTSFLAYRPEQPLAKGTLQIDPLRLVGEYSICHGLDYGLHLVLKDEGSYTCTKIRCLVCGYAEGDWSIDDKGLALRSKNSDGELKVRPLGRLQIAIFRDHYLFVLAEDLNDIETFGLSVATCLHKPVTEKLLDQEQDRRHQDLVDRSAEGKQKKQPKESPLQKPPDR